MWRGACRGWNHWRRQRQWRGWMKQPFCSRLKFTDKASCLSDLLGPRKNWGNRSLWAYVFRWGNSIQGDFRCGCRFILEHIKECHQHVCSSGLTGVSLFCRFLIVLVVLSLRGFLILPKWRYWWEREGVSQDAADYIKEDRNGVFVVRKDRL